VRLREASQPGPARRPAQHAGYRPATTAPSASSAQQSRSARSVCQPDTSSRSGWSSPSVIRSRGV